jgi:hypothetical protein
VVTGDLQSSVARFERQRSVLLYEAGPTGDFRDGAIGHGVSQGGAQSGQVTITGSRRRRSPRTASSGSRPSAAP